MKHTDYLLIGGGLAAARAVSAIRERDKKGRITIVTEEGFAPYDRPPLSKQLLRGEVKPGQIRSESRLFYLKNRVRLIKNTSVTDLDLAGDHQHAYLSSGHPIAFKKAMLATGGAPVNLDVPGADLERVFTLRNIPDSLAIASAVRTVANPRAVVVGAGFIGLEMAASLTEMGASVTVVEQADRPWSSFAPPAISRFVQTHLQKKGVKFVFGETVTRFGARAGEQQVSSVALSNGPTLECDLVCLAVGIKPNLALAERAGLVVEDGVVTDTYLQTSYTNVYAAGDIAAVPDPITGRPRRVEHYGQAETTGALAGRAMAGDPGPYNLISYVWSDLFDLHLEAAGDESQWDETITRSNRDDERSFIVMGLKEGRVRVFWAMNTPDAEFGPIRILIQQQIDVSGARDELADPEYSLVQLLR